MRWQLSRGVLAPLNAAPPGSPWWRAVNERLLRDGCEAVARSGGMGGPPSSHTVDLWMFFVADPTARTWYRAHNASIASAYLDHHDLAGGESRPERFFLNVVLLRVLYAHALVAAPRLALGRLASVGPLLGDPRLSMTGIFLSLSRVLPDRYPLGGEVAAYVAAEHNIGEMLDYGLIAPRLQQLYEWSAQELDEPRLLDCIRDGSPTYAWSYADREVWHPAQPAVTICAIRRLLPAKYWGLVSPPRRPGTRCTEAAFAKSAARVLRPLDNRLSRRPAPPAPTQDEYDGRFVVKLHPLTRSQLSEALALNHTGG